jgi:hypothetical protein
MENLRKQCESFLFPPIIRTPEVEKDVENYLGITQETFSRISNEKIKSLLILLVERIEFIKHLKILKNYFASKQSTDLTGRFFLPTERILDKEFLNQHPEIKNHDFAGLNFDIEALIIYLLITCIDATIDYICEIKEINRAGRNTSTFVQIFKNYLPSGLKRQFVNCYIVIESNNSNNELGLDELIRIWKDKNEEQKLELVAKYLYKVRSKFTHKSIRSFLPSRRLPLIALKCILNKIEEREFLLLAKPDDDCNLANSLEESIKHFIKLAIAIHFHRELQLLPEEIAEILQISEEFIREVLE